MPVKYPNNFINCGGKGINRAGLFKFFAKISINCTVEISLSSETKKVSLAAFGELIQSIIKSIKFDIDINERLFLILLKGSMKPFFMRFANFAIFKFIVTGGSYKDIIEKIDKEISLFLGIEKSEVAKHAEYETLFTLELDKGASIKYSCEVTARVRKYDV